MGLSADPSARDKRRAARRARIDDGVEALGRWLDDLVRDGLSSAETRPAEFWQHAAARLVDAQAPGLARRVTRLGELPDAGPEWPEAMLRAIGRLSLVLEAWSRLDALPADRQDDVRQAVGWSLRRDEVLQRGPRVADTWSVVGQVEEEDERLRSQRTWLIGTGGVWAEIRQYAPGQQAFEQVLVQGTCFEAELSFWPGTVRRRALVAERRSPPRSGIAPFPRRGVRELLDSVADDLASNPWLSSFPTILCDVAAVRDSDRTWLVDRAGQGVPALYTPTLLAMSGGHPVDVAGLWAAGRLEPWSVLTEGTLVPVGVV